MILDGQKDNLMRFDGKHLSRKHGSFVGLTVSGSVYLFLKAKFAVIRERLV